jgi:hypothetical protein
MWLCTKHGFYSVKWDSEDRYFIRARRRRDLENLIELMSKRWVGSPDEVDVIRSISERGDWSECSPWLIMEWPGADYRFRLIVSQRALRDAYAALADGIDYPNFKGEIADRLDQHDHLELYHRVWAVMGDLQEE